MYFTVALHPKHCLNWVNFLLNLYEFSLILMVLAFNSYGFIFFLVMIECDLKYSIVCFLILCEFSKCHVKRVLLEIVN